MIIQLTLGNGSPVLIDAFKIKTVCTKGQFVKQCLNSSVWIGDVHFEVKETIDQIRELYMQRSAVYGYKDDVLTTWERNYDNC